MPTTGLGPDDAVICSGSLSRAPLDLAVPAASAAGFSGLSVYYDDYVELRRRGWSPTDVQDLLVRHHVRIAELDGVCRWLPGDTVGPTLDDFLDVAAELGARSVTVLEIARRSLDDDLGMSAIVRCFADACDRADRYGLLVHIEYFPFSAVDSLSLACEVVRRAERPNGGVMLDTWHHWRGPDAGRLDSIAAAATMVTGVQLGDIAAAPTADRRHEMMHGRLLPGSGRADLTSLVRLLRDHGCVAPLEVEVYSDELAQLDPHAAAHACRAASRRVMAG